MGFAHLHVHTEYSLLDGAARIGDLLKTTKELGMTSIAITDHGAMFGVVDFYKKAKKEGIKPILGCEVYTAARTMKDNDPEKDKYQGHLVLLAENNEGYRNLMKIVSEAYINGFYKKARVDKALLREHSKGIIALSACIQGNVQRKLLNRDYAGAKAEALELQEIFGKGNFFLELQNHGLDEQMQILPDMKNLHQETGIPFVVTNDVHYVRQEDAEAHDVLLCIQTAANMDDPKRMRFPNNEFYLKDEKEMRQLFPGIPEAADNTEAIAERCNVELEFGKPHLPEYDVPEGKTKEGYLKELCLAGLKVRYGENPDAALIERMETELAIIQQMGFVEYFLVVWDFINYAKTNGIPVGPGRGSAAGSIVAYSLQITDVDPIKYSLIFERFLNPERISMPDIDIDFCYERRSEVNDYIVRKYGEDKVAQIATFGTMKAKAAVRDVGRALGMPYSDCDAIAKAIPNGAKMTIDKALEMSAILREKYDDDPGVKKLLDTARKLEGISRHSSIHPAGVVISQKSITNYVPIFRSDKGLATQYVAATLEEMGLLKIDLLALRTITVIKEAIDMIKKNYGVEIDFKKMGRDDPKAYAGIAAGNTKGIFQLESARMTAFMRNLKPDCFEDVVAGISLYRPGPKASIPTYIQNKRNQDKIEYLHESLIPILGVTYGCLVYQEQVMQIVRDLAGFSYGRSDNVRRAMSKKKVDEMLQEEHNFIYGNEDCGIDGCVKRGIPEEKAKEIFRRMMSFAEYGFNKSHAAAYAVVAYETAYLKAHYPVEFMAATLSSLIGEKGSPKDLAGYVRNCAEMGIEVLPPSILESGVKFTLKDGKIRFALLGIKAVGRGVAEEIIRSREEKGLPKDIFQFIRDIDTTVVNKKAVESLIRAGALDDLNPNRAQHLAVYERLMESAQSNARKNIQGQMSLFGMESAADAMEGASISAELLPINNYPNRKLLDMEKETMGIYISGHPLNDYAEVVKEISTATSEEINPDLGMSEDEDGMEQGFDGAGGAEEDAAEDMEQSGPQRLPDGTRVRIAGIITHVKTLVTKSGKMMAFAEIEDLVGSVEVVIFPKVYERCSDLIAEDNIVALAGTVNHKEGSGTTVLADRILDIEDGKLLLERSEARKDKGKPQGQAAEKPMPKTSSGGKYVALRMDDSDARAAVDRIKDILADHPGNIPVRVYLTNGEKFQTDTKLWVNPEADFINQIEQVVGEKNIKVITGGKK